MDHNFKLEKITFPTKMTTIVHYFCSIKIYTIHCSIEIYIIYCSFPIYTFLLSTRCKRLLLDVAINIFLVQCFVKFIAVFFLERKKINIMTYIFKIVFQSWHLGNHPFLILSQLETPRQTPNIIKDIKFKMKKKLFLRRCSSEKRDRS